MGCPSLCFEFVGVSGAPVGRLFRLSVVFVGSSDTAEQLDADSVQRTADHFLNIQPRPAAAAQPQHAAVSTRRKPPARLGGSAARSSSPNCFSNTAVPPCSINRAPDKHHHSLELCYRLQTSQLRVLQRHKGAFKNPHSLRDKTALLDGEAGGAVW